MSQNSKKTRAVEIGWVCFQEIDSSYKQVRSKYGGGTRKISVPKDTKCSELLEMAKRLFFPEEISTKGHLSEFNCELLDFKSHQFDLDYTVQEMYDISSMNMLRFYLASSKKTNDNDYTPISRFTNRDNSVGLTTNLRASHTRHTAGKYDL